MHNHVVIPAGVMPAAVTPMTPSGEIDLLSFAKLAAYYRAAGCSGIVIAGTNGEGPSLSAVEKRDFARSALKLCAPLPVILGIATPSLHEAKWLASQAEKAGCSSVLVMPPGYFRSASERGILDWFLELANSTSCPLIPYSFPKFTGFTMSPEFVAELAKHPNVVGFKDSSGEAQNLESYRSSAPGKRLYVGDETLLLESLRAGWNGSISGASNLIPQWLSEVCRLFSVGDESAAETKFELIRPVIELIRQQSQPAANKSVLAEWEVISSNAVRLPLKTVEVESLLQSLSTSLGLK